MGPLGRTDGRREGGTDLERGAEGGDELRGELLDEAHRVGQEDLGEGALELRQGQLAVGCVVGVGVGGVRGGVGGSYWMVGTGWIHMIYNFH